MSVFSTSACIAVLLSAFVAASGWYVAAQLRNARSLASEPGKAAAKPEVKPVKPEAKAVNQSQNESSQPAADQADLPKTAAEWRKVLTEHQFQITRMKGTERAFTGEYWNTKTPGTYKCVCCGEPLFTSAEKFDSHCGWPSFYQPIDGVTGKTGLKIAEHPDRTHGMIRTEVTCKKCGAHLGHVFDDSPQTPTGLRYCINSASLKLEEKKPAAEPPAK